MSQNERSEQLRSDHESDDSGKENSRETHEENGSSKTEATRIELLCSVRSVQSDTSQVKRVLSTRSVSLIGKTTLAIKT